MKPSDTESFIRNMQHPENRINMTWFYPKICGFQDKLTDHSVEDYFKSLKWPPQGHRPKLLIYVHIPFCRSFCSFCACYKEHYHKWKDGHQKPFVDALLAQIRLTAAMPQFREARPAYIQFGGGTPSVLDHNVLKRIKDCLADSFDLSQLEGFSFEANAMDLAKPDYAAGLEDIGVSRISYGVQTTNEKIRRTLGIKASVQQVRQAADNLHAAGIASFAVDLIYNLPGQDRDGLMADMIHISTRLKPAFFQTYPFNRWKGSRLDKRIQDREFGNTATQTEELAHYRIIAKQLPVLGYKERVIVNFFARERPDLPVGLEYACGANALQGAHTLGFGPSAESYLGVYCHRNIASVDQWIQYALSRRQPVQHARRVNPEEMVHRQLAFFPVFGTILKRDAHADPAHKRTFDALLREGYLEETGAVLTLTEKGMEYAGNIAYEFYSPEEKLRANRTMYLSIKNRRNPFHQDAIAM